MVQYQSGFPKERLERMKEQKRVVHEWINEEFSIPIDEILAQSAMAKEHVRLKKDEVKAEDAIEKRLEKGDEGTAGRNSTRASRTKDSHEQAQGRKKGCEESCKRARTGTAPTRR